MTQLDVMAGGERGRSIKWVVNMCNRMDPTTEESKILLLNSLRPSSFICCQAQHENHNKWPLHHIPSAQLQCSSMVERKSFS